LPAHVLTVIESAIPHFGIVFLLFVSAYGLGKRILRRVLFANAWEDVAFSAGLGLGILAQAVFLLGLARLIHAWTIGVLLLAAAAVGARDLIATAGSIWRAIRRPKLVPSLSFAALVAVFIALSTQPLYPPYQWDALSYHLPSAREFAETGAVRPTPYLRFCAFPQLNEMLYTLLFTFSDVISVQIAQFLLLLLTCAAIAGAALRLDRAAMLPAGLAWLGIPFVVVIGSQGYIDVGLALFCTLLILAGWRWLESREMRWVVVAAAFGGFAGGTKYTGMFIAGCFGLLLIADALRRRTFRQVLVYSAVVAAIAGSWYAYVYYYTGNPVFPFLSRVFGTGCWNQADIEHVEGELFSRLGTSRTLGSLLMLPWNLAFEPQKFHMSAPLNAVVFGGIPLWLVAGAISKKTRFLAGMATAYLLFWFFTAQEPRYLFPVLPVISVLLGFTIAQVVRRAPPFGRAIASIVMAVVVVFPSLEFVWERHRILGWPPSSQTETDTFFRRFKTYDCYRWLNTNYGDDYVMYAYDLPYMAYFADGTRIGDILGVGRLRDAPRTSGTSVKTSLRNFGAQLVLFSTDPDHPQPPPADASFRANFRLVTTCAGGSVWRMTPFEQVELEGEDRLVNGGFESMEGWSRSPALLVESTGRASWSGTTAVRVAPSSIPLFQTFDARPNQPYRIKFHTRADPAPASVRFVLSWFDEGGRNLRDEVHLAPAPGAWSSHSFVSVSPPNAVKGTVYPEGLDNAIWYDDVSVRQIRYEPRRTSSDHAVLLGVLRNSSKQLFLKRELSHGFADEIISSRTTGIPLAGDFDGDTKLDAAVYDPVSGVIQASGRTFLVQTRALPISGRWSAGATWSVGTFDSSSTRFTLHFPDGSVKTVVFGERGDLPVAGDWNGDGVDTIGVYRPSTQTFLLRNENTAGVADVTWSLGSGVEIPVAGDWNNDGRATPGLYHPDAATFIFLGDDGTETRIPFGLKGDMPFAGTR
jgi:hypothetical protein